MNFKKLVFICIMLLIWYTSARTFYFAVQGPDISFELDDNYRLYGWPGFIARIDSDEPLLKGKNYGSIDKFAVTEKYIIAQAKDGWLAINRNTHQVWGCYGTIGHLENSVGEEFGDMVLVDELPRDRVFIPRKTWIALIILSLPFVGIIIGVLCYPFSQLNRDSRPI